MNWYGLFHILILRSQKLSMCSVKKVFLEISQKSQENTGARVSFLIKLQALSKQLYWKRDSGTGVFLKILWNFSEHLFLQNTSSGCFGEVFASRRNRETRYFQNLVLTLDKTSKFDWTPDDIRTEKISRFFE